MHHFSSPLRPLSGLMHLLPQQPWLLHQPGPPQLLVLDPSLDHLIARKDQEVPLQLFLFGLEQVDRAPEARKDLGQQQMKNDPPKPRQHSRVW